MKQYAATDHAIIRGVSPSSILLSAQDIAADAIPQVEGDVRVALASLIQLIDYIQDNLNWGHM
jgi:hypothetical protein